MNKSTNIKVVDLFAGPGGLSEGFSLCHSSDDFKFETCLAIEKDNYAHATLVLRHFLRRFPKFPEEYFEFRRGEITLEQLYDEYQKEFQYASKICQKVELSEKTRAQVSALVAEAVGSDEKWVLVGGPPCQAYSLVGRSRMKASEGFEKDHRHVLYREYLDIISQHSPPVFVMENVRGILSSRYGDKKVFDQIIDDLRNPRNNNEKEQRNCSTYNLYSCNDGKLVADNANNQRFLVKAEQYGIPQARHRVFILGIRSDFEGEVNGLKQFSNLTVEDAIGDLPFVRSRISKGQDSAKEWQKLVKRGASKFDELPLGRKRLCLEQRLTQKNRNKCDDAKKIFQDYVKDCPEEAPIQHEARSHMPSDIERYAFASNYAFERHKSPKLCDYPKALLPAHKNTEMAVQGKMFSDRFRVQVSHRASTTITSHISKDGHYYIHYDPKQARSLTVREAARLQTFPDSYYFVGPRTAQYHQVGNAVPPLLARNIAHIVRNIFKIL